MKVYLNDPIAPSALRRLKKHVEVIDNFDRPEELDAIIVRQQYCPGEIIRRAKKCRLIQQHGVSLDRIDTDAARECGIPVKNTPGVNSRSVAEFTVAMMLDLSRRVTQTDCKTRRGSLPAFGMPETVGVEMTGKKLGLIGAGHIARDVAQICSQGFRMELYCFDPHKSEAELTNMGFNPMGLHELFTSCDYVSVHCPLNKETYHMIDDSCFLRSNSKLILINTARGGIVDEAALYGALVSGRLAAAGLDVFEKEPPSVDNPLLKLPNFLAGMHVAGSTHEALERNGRAVVDSVFEALGING